MPEIDKVISIPFVPAFDWGMDIAVRNSGIVDIGGVARGWALRVCGDRKYPYKY